MTKIAQIKKMEDTEEFINILKNNELFIYEEVEGSSIFVKWDGTHFVIKPKSLKMDELNFIDLTVQKFYNQAYIYLHSLPNFVTDLVNTNWWFCFEYFPDNQPANVTYNRVPKNNLILNCIIKGSKWEYDYNELVEYSNLFGVDMLPIVYKGKLSQKQLEVIDLYLNTSEEDIKYLFDNDNFAYFFYKILNPKIDNSFLMNKDNFNDNLEKIIIKIDGKSKYSFEILNPLYQKMNLINSTEYVEIYTLILLKFLEFCQLIDLKKYKITKYTKDELYVEYISLLFNDFMNDTGSSIKKWDFNIPQFFKQDKFKINVGLLFNEDTKNYLLSDEKIEYIFKCILGSFNKKRKKPIGIFNDITISLFNRFVDEIDLLLDDNLKINKEHVFQSGDLKNFKDYFNIKFNVDSKDDIYPDVFDEFGGEEGGDKKGKGGKKKEIPEIEINTKPGIDEKPIK
jgi:hypothetical protein